MTQTPNQNSAIPQKGETYYHYKYFTAPNPEENQNSYYTYKIIGLAGNAHEDNYSQVWVVYEPLVKTTHLSEFGIDCYIRPLKEFLEVLEIDNCQMPRFTKTNYITNLKK
jgi:hypothetical protein